MADNEEEGVIRRAKKPTKLDPTPKPAPAPTPAPEPAAAAPSPATPEASAPKGFGGEHEHTNGACPSCTRLRAALRSARQRLRRLATENKTLREELLSAGEMIENLAQDLEKPY